MIIKKYIIFFIFDRVDRFGDQSIEAAPAWFEYGNALLLTEEENPTDDLLGAAAAEAKKAAKALGDEMGVLYYHIAHSNSISRFNLIFRFILMHDGSGRFNRAK